MEQIGNRIEALRNKHMLAKADLASKVGIKEEELDSYESLKIEPDLLMVQRIAYSLNEPLEFFFVDSESLRNPAFNPGLTFILFSFLRKNGSSFLNVLFNIEKDTVTSTLRYEFVGNDGKITKLKFNADEETTTLFIAGIDKCQVINWREVEYGASLSNICTYFSDKLYVRPETFRYRYFMESFLNVSKKFLSEEYVRIIESVDINEDMFYHKELDYDTTKKVLKTIEKTREFVDSKVSLADQIFWDMY